MCDCGVEFENAEHYFSDADDTVTNVYIFLLICVSQSARYFFFDYSPSGYLNKMFHSPNEILIAQTFCCGHNSYKSY